MKKFYKFKIALAFIGFTFGLQAQTTILNETLLTPGSFANFTTASVTGAQVWSHSTQYGAVCSGFSGGSSFANEDWLISPPMNLTQADNANLTFDHTRGSSGVINVGVAEGWYKAFATANYTGNPATTQWVELTGLNQNIGSAWTYISSGVLVIPAVAKSANTRVAFRYMSSATQSATWEIKNVKVTGVQTTDPGTAVFKVTNWNTEWLGCAQTGFGPDNEAQQLANVASAMLAMDSDIYCLQEVSHTITAPTLTSLINLMGSTVWEAKMATTWTDDCDQRQVIIYKKAKVQYLNGTLIENGPDYMGNTYWFNWSNGRVPARFNVNFVAGTTLIPVTIINIHGKAQDTNPMSYTRRKGASEGLKTLLSANYYTDRNIILTGDFNDFLVGTNSTATCNCAVSPYKNFMDDTANYMAITQNITDAYWSRPLIEHVIVSNELTDNYVANSAMQETGVPQSIPGFFNNTSNHLPVTVKLSFAVTAGLDEVKPAENSWMIYPNPVKNSLTIAFTNEPDNKYTEIYDITGRRVYGEMLNGNSVDVSALPAGIYILKMGNVGRKFVKE